MRIIRRLELICIIITTGFVIALMFIPDKSYAVGDDEVVVVSIGDSYSSGEGIEPFYGQGESSIKKKVKNKDWLAHRSELSWPGMLIINDNYLRNHRPMNKEIENHITWYFVASSGAETKDLYKKQKKVYCKRKISTVVGKTAILGDVIVEGEDKLDPQLDVFETIDEGSVDYVTATLGGNDLGFSSIVTTAVLEPRFLHANLLESKLQKAWDKYYEGEEGDKPVKQKLRESYLDINNRVVGKAEIIIAGYPTLVCEKGGGPFDTKESQKINRNVRKFNKELKKLVENTGRNNIHFVPVADAFKGREAYSDKPLINPVLIHKLEDIEDGINPASSYSIHPNKKGAEMYAKCVQDEIDRLESKKDTTSKDVIGAWYWAGSGATPPIKLNKDGTLEVEEVAEEWEAKGTWTCKGKTVIIVRDGVEEKLEYNKQKDILFYEQGGEESCYKRYDQESGVQRGTYLDYFASINQANKPYSEIDKKYSLKSTDEMTDSWMTFASNDDRFHFTFHSTNTKMFDNGLGDSWDVPDDPNPSDRCERMSGSAKDMLGIKESISEQEFQKKCKDQLMFPMGAGPGVDLMTSTYTGLVDICTLSDGNTYHILLKDVLYGEDIDPDTEVFIQYYPFDKNKDSLQMEGGY